MRCTIMVGSPEPRKEALDDRTTPTVIDSPRPDVQSSWLGSPSLGSRSLGKLDGPPERNVPQCTVSAPA